MRMSVDGSVDVTRDEKSMSYITPELKRLKSIIKLVCLITKKNSILDLNMRGPST